MRSDTASRTRRFTFSLDLDKRIRFLPIVEPDLRSLENNRNGVARVSFVGSLISHKFLIFTDKCTSSRYTRSQFTSTSGEIVPGEIACKTRWHVSPS